MDIFRKASRVALLSVILFGIIVAYAVNSQSASLPIPKTEGKPETIQLVANTWGKLMAQCPGLAKYKSDLTFLGIRDMIFPDLGEMSRVEVVVNINDDTNKIPDSFRAWGHTCGYGISPDGALLRIQKSACVSVCLDVEYEGPTDYVVNL